MDNQADFLLELFEDCQYGRHKDLDYPQFKLYDSLEEELLQAENYPKKVGKHINAVYTYTMPYIV